MAEKTASRYTALGALEKSVYNFGRNVKEGSLAGENAALSDERITWEDLRKLAKRMKFRTVLLRPGADELREVPAPAIVRMKNGSYVMLGLHNDETVLFIDVNRDRPVAMPAKQFLEVWTGEILTISPMLTWAEFRRRYNLEWFYQVILHYKQIFTEVFIASAFLQAMGILMPLFTQVVIDKVIGNDGISTLTVLGVSMLVFAFVQAGLSGIRTHLLNQTTTKLDAILGTRLFRHLISLPVPYYEHRRVGDTLMRVGSLGSVREFLTGTTLTTILDAIFSVIFIAMMLYYSVSLTVSRW